MYNSSSRLYSSTLILITQLNARRMASPYFRRDDIWPICVKLLCVQVAATYIARKD